MGPTHCEREDTYCSTSVDQRYHSIMMMMKMRFLCIFPILLFHRKLAGLSLPPVFVFLMCYFYISIHLWEFIRVPFLLQNENIDSLPYWSEISVTLCYLQWYWLVKSWIGKGLRTKECYPGSICNKPVGPVGLGIQNCKGPLFCCCEACKITFEIVYRITFGFMNILSKN